MLSVKTKLLLARICNRSIKASRQLCGLSMRTRCRRRGINWDLDLDEGIDLCIYLLGSYEGSILRTYSTLLKPGDVVFDIGANVGSHTLHFARLVGDSGAVHAFEPTEYAFRKLNANLALNPVLAGRVRPHQVYFTEADACALPESICSSWPVDRWTSKAIREKLDEQHLGKLMPVVGAKAMSADSFCASSGLSRLDLVKLDVDGNERAVLQGFHGVLSQFRPKILVELAPFVYDSGSGGTFDSFVDYLAGFKYDFFAADTKAAIPSSGAGLHAVIPDGMSINALLLPR